MNADDVKFLHEALEEAKQGVKEGGVPVGAVLVHQGKIISRGRNKWVQENSAIKHGEMDCFQNAGTDQVKLFKESTLYTTLSPCSMCSGCVLFYKIPRVVVGNNQSYAWEESHLRNRGVVVDVINDRGCIEVLDEFLHSEENRRIWDEHLGC